MKRLLPTISLAVIALCMFLTPQSVEATHAMGADITYTCIGTDRYQFTLNFYRDCAGVQWPGSATLNYNSNNCNLSGNIPLTLVSGPIEVSPLCPTQIGSSTCNGGGLPGVQQIVYQGTVIFPAQCSDWTITWDHCCRNNQITNLVNPGGNSMLIGATLDNTNGLCNSSPTFSSLPVPYICAGQQFCYNHGAFDSDGDSLVYSLINALDGPAPGSPITYTGTLSATNPLSTFSGNVNFDNATGSMCVVPDAPQVSVVTVRVDEYRNGVVVGSTMRDLQIVVQNCANIQPYMVNGGIQNLVDGVLVDSNSVEICPGVPFSFQLEFADTSALGVPDHGLTINTNLGLVIPGASVNVSGANPNPDTLFFDWTPTGADIGFYNFTVTVQDTGCPILGSQVFAFDITVLEGTTAGPDQTYCSNGAPVQLNASGGTIFTWSVIQGDASSLTCNPCATQTVTPDTTTTYEVLSDISAVCKNRDTVVVHRVQNFSITAGPDQNLCNNGADTLQGATGPPAQGPYTYSWSPSGGLSDTTVVTPVVTAGVNNQYVLTAVSDSGCILTDTVDINIIGTAPIVNIAPTDTVCSGTDLQMDANICLECGTSTNTCTGPASSTTIGAAATAATVVGPMDLDAVTPRSFRKQYIFGADELAGAGFTCGMISAIEVDISAAGSTVNGMEIRMGCTNRDRWGAAIDTFETGLNTVVNPFNFSPVPGINVINLDNNYQWDGATNLVIEFCVPTAQTGTASSFRYTTVTGASPQKVLSLNVDNANGACDTTLGSSFTTRPNMTFQWCQALPPITYSWTPAGLFDFPANEDPIATPTGNATFQLQVNDGTCDGTGFIDVISPQTFSLNLGNDTTVCRNSNVLLAANPPGALGPYTYAWTPQTGMQLPIDTTASSVVVGPALTTRYYVTAESDSGCGIQDSIDITVSGVAPILDALGPDTICPGGLTTLNPAVALASDTTSLPCTGPNAIDTVGSATFTSNTISPYYKDPFSFQGYRRQYIITRQELNAAGITAGRINSIGFNVTAVGATTPDIANFRMLMGVIPDSTFPGNAFYSGLTEVIPTTLHVVTPGLNTHTLTYPYNWDGTSNLIIEICTQTFEMQGDPSTVDVTCLGANRTLSANNPFDAGCQGFGVSPPVTGTPNTCRPDMVFNTCEALPSFTYSWTPSTGLSATNIRNPDANPTVSTTYTVTADDGNGCIAADFVTVEVDSSAYVDALVDTSGMCTFDTVLLNASITGQGQVLPLASCGTNATTCTQSSYVSQVGAGLSQQAPVGPFNGGNDDHKVQWLFKASELQAAGMSSGTITVIAFNIIDKQSSGGFENFTLALNAACTTLTDLDIPSGWVPTTPVLGPNTVVTNFGWNAFALASPWDWDGTSDIVLEACYNNPDGALIGGDGVEYTSGFTYNSVMTASSNNPGDDGCLLNPANTSTIRANVQFTVCPPTPQPFTYTWAPPLGLSDPNIAAPTGTSVQGNFYTVTVGGGNCTIQDTVTVPICSTLPYDEVLIDANPVTGGVLVDWTVLNELNMDRYYVERSSDATNFSDLDLVPAVGTSAKAEYLFLDNAPVLGRNFYRIRMIGQNSEVSYSDVVEVLFTGDQSRLLGIYPNPVPNGHAFNIEYLAREDGNIRIELLDLMGRQIGQIEREVVKGENVVTFPAMNLPAGTYFVRTRGGNAVNTHKVQIL